MDNKAEETLTKKTADIHPDSPEVKDSFDINQYKATLEKIESNEEIYKELLKQIKENNIRQLKIVLPVIKNCYYSLLEKKNGEKLSRFVNEGGQENDYAPIPSPTDLLFKEELKKTYISTKAYNKRLEQEKNENIELRKKLLYELKTLVSNKLPFHDNLKRFKEIRSEWKNIGPIHRQNIKEIWNNYGHHVTHFYEYISLNNELREIDLQKNLDEKVEICKNAETLLTNNDINHTYWELQKLHRLWKESGPVPKQDNESTWQRFKEASDKLKEKYLLYREQLKKEAEDKIKVKERLLLEFIELNKIKLQNISFWKEYDKKIITVLNEWKEIGHLPLKADKKLGIDYKDELKQYYARRREYFKNIKKEQEKNLSYKKLLCEMVEKLISEDINDWSKAAQEVKNLQSKWKTSGRVPRNHSDVIWNKFKKACDTFFNLRKEKNEMLQKEQERNLKEKEILISEIGNYSGSLEAENINTFLESIFVRWNNIGLVPFNHKSEIEKCFDEIIQQLVKNINLNDDKKEDFLYEFRVNTLWNASGNDRYLKKLTDEKNSINKRISQITTDINKTEHNLSFFNVSKGAASLLKGQEDKIQEMKEQIDRLNNKVRIIGKAINKAEKESLAVKNEEKIKINN